MEQAIAILLEQGGMWAAIALVAIYWGWTKDKQVGDLQNKRLEDMKEITKDSTDAIYTVTETIERLAHKLKRDE